MWLAVFVSRKWPVSFNEFSEVGLGNERCILGEQKQCAWTWQTYGRRVQTKGQKRTALENGKLYGQKDKKER